MVDIVTGDGKPAEPNAQCQCYNGGQFVCGVGQNYEEKCFHAESAAIEHLSEREIPFRSSSQQRIFGRCMCEPTSHLLLSSCRSFADGRPKLHPMEQSWPLSSAVGRRTGQLYLSWCRTLFWGTAFGNWRAYRNSTTDKNSQWQWHTLALTELCNSTASSQS